MQYEFLEEFTYYHEGVRYKKARVTAKIGRLVYLDKPLSGEHVYLVEEYLEDEDCNLIACISVDDDYISLDDVEHSVLIPIDAEGGMHIEA
ncbi:hypothetical protein [Sporosarcina sp. SAFN-015]|uniref:hypothetical protein n=1 Tax=Sporosarcina sp. SAFN-015 TaxID=3387274 RepID=UPI003F7FCC9D